MGVDVVLKQVNQPGTSPKRRRLTQVDAVLDGSDLFARICENSDLPELNRVDPYGTLILTGQDMPQFIFEVDTVRRTWTQGAPERDLLDAIRRLAERCAEDVSLELHLEGD
ncbi:hypothetical protein [Streptomyces sp. TS71-3]|uniref:hypothetical protein n=1 Tax=Streptomyces sp. TS71-3 TaxID=2733862 RepID=UPI001B1AF296|nr:hypothetical protein [Streptomyces sp. TS71-3]GHJ35480.1 hypothetical protein Sm713_10890 [Streptomyces sp. TS71-3]